MIEHCFWGYVEEDWAGFSAELTYCPPDFPSRRISIFLGEEFDEDGEEVEAAPSLEDLDLFQATFEEFKTLEKDIFKQIKEQCFQRYLKLYAPHYENSAQSGKPPLGVATRQEHFRFIEEILLIRVLSDKEIVIPMRYKLDREHGIEVRLKSNRLVDIGGIAET